MSSLDRQPARLTANDTEPDGFSHDTSLYIYGGYELVPPGYDFSVRISPPRPSSGEGGQGGPEVRTPNLLQRVRFHRSDEYTEVVVARSTDYGFFRRSSRGEKCAVGYLFRTTWAKLPEEAGSRQVRTVKHPVSTRHIGKQRQLQELKHEGQLTVATADRAH